MLVVPKSVYEAMITHAKGCYPQEACGFVTGEGSRADGFIPMENVEHSSVSYLMDPKAQLRVFRDLEAQKKTLVGIFHSHVASPASPSQKDKAMAFYPELFYLIVSLSDMQKPDLRAFRIADDRVSPEEITLQ